MTKEDKIYVAGHTGLVGSALVRHLKDLGYNNLITRNSQELDLCNQQAVAEFFMHERPDYVFLAAAKVGGIKANNDYPADFIYKNLMIECNILESAYRSGVKKLLFLGSSCIYPRDCLQPIKEEYLLTGPLEQTNKAYAIAKIAGIELCQSYRKQYGVNFISCMPTNLYGPHDNFNLETAHVLPALIAKLILAQETNQPVVKLWGTGNPRREFLHVDDLARAVVFLMLNYNENLPINVGVGNDISIKELAYLIKELVGYNGDLQFEHNSLDGTPQKLLDVSQLHSLGWKSSISLKEGIESTINWYRNNTCKN